MDKKWLTFIDRTKRFNSNLVKDEMSRNISRFFFGTTALIKFSVDIETAAHGKPVFNPFEGLRETLRVVALSTWNSGQWAVLGVTRPTLRGRNVIQTFSRVTANPISRYPVIK